MGKRAAVRLVRAEFGEGLITEVLLEAVDEHARAFRDTTLRDGFADAGDTAGDEDDFVFETGHRFRSR